MFKDMPGKDSSFGQVSTLQDLSQEMQRRQFDATAILISEQDLQGVVESMIALKANFLATRFLGTRVVSEWAIRRIGKDPNDRNGEFDRDEGKPYTLLPASTAINLTRVAEVAVSPGIPYMSEYRRTVYEAKQFLGLR